jgi:hypothetical protein
MTASAAHDASVRMDVVGDAAAAAGDDWPVASDADVERWGVAFDAATGASALSPRDDEDEDARPRAPDDDRASRPGVSGAAAVPLLSAIGAPRDVLRRIWDLADADRSGLLTWDEFVLAMYLAERAAEGREPPAAIPNASGRWSTFPPREKKPHPPDASPAKRGASRAFPGNDDAAAEISRSRAADASESTVPARPASAIKTLSPSTKPPLPARVLTPGLTPPGLVAERSSRNDYSPLVANTTTPPRVASPAALAKLHADAARRDAKLASARRAAEIRSALDDAADATHSPRINAYSRDIERSPAQTLERRAAGIAMRRERTRWERREWARMEEEEALAARSTHAGVARSDDAAFAERVEKWRRDEVERERRLERMRETLDAEARGARGRGAAARGSEASGVGRSGPWHERLYQSPRERTTPRRGSVSLLAAAEEAEAEARAEEFGRGEGEAASEMGRGEGEAASEMGRGEGEAASSTASVYSPAASASRSPAAGSAGASSAARLHLDAAARLARRVRAARADADAREDEARRGATLSRASTARDARRRRAAFLAAARPVVVVDPREDECDAAQSGGSVDGDDVASTLRAAGLLPRDAGAGSRSITSRRAEALAVYRVCECLKAERPSPSSSADPPAAAKGRTVVPATLLAAFVGAAVAETLGGSRVEGALRDGAANDDSHSPAEEKNPSIPPPAFASALEAAFDAGFAAASSSRSRRSGARPPWVPASFDGERAEAARDALDALVGAEAAFARLAATGEKSGDRRSSEEAIARSPQRAPSRRGAETDAPDESGAAARARAEKDPFDHTSVANKESVADRLARKKARAEAALAAKRAARLDAERAECTFAPRISAASSAIVGSSGSRPRSFVRATEKYLTREEREALEAAACTFAPRITPRPRYLGKDPNATRREEEEKRRRAKERRRRSARDAPWEGPPPWESPPRKPRHRKKTPGTRERTRASSASPGTKTRAPASRAPASRVASRKGSFGTAPASGPLARCPSGFEATVARLRAASAARAEAAKAARSAVDRRAAWIDPRAAEKKTAAEKTRDAKAAAAAEMPAAWRASENARRDETTPAKTRGVSRGSKASATRDDGAETPGAKNEPGGALSPALAKLSSTYTPGILPPRPDRAAFDASAAGEAAAFERTGRDADASEALAARTPADESPTVTMRVPPSPGGGRSPTPGRNRGGSSSPFAGASPFGNSPALASATLSMTKNSPSLRHRSESRGATPSVSEDGLPYSPFAGPGRTILAMELSVGLDREKRDGSLRTATLEFRETDAVPAAAARFCDQHKLSNATRRDVEAVLETALRQYFAHASAEEDEQKGE